MMLKVNILLFKSCLSLYHTCMKLEYYMLPKEVSVICKIDIVKCLLNRPVLQERLMRWAIKWICYKLCTIENRQKIGSS